MRRRTCSGRFSSSPWSPLPAVRFFSRAVLLCLCTITLYPSTCDAQQYFYRLYPSIPKDEVPAKTDMSVFYSQDAPTFVPQSIGYTFNFFGVPYTSVNVSPFGSLHFNAYDNFCCSATGTPATTTCGLTTAGCGLTSYENMMAAFMANLSPKDSTSPNRRIQYGLNSLDTFIVKFTDIQVKDLPVVMETFEVVLKSPSFITVNWVTLNDNSGTTPYLVGARMKFGGDPWTTNAADWGMSTRNGVYPPKSFVKSGNAMDMCGIGWMTCLTPTFGSVTGGNKVFLYVTGETGCFLPNSPFRAAAFKCKFNDATTAQSVYSPIAAKLNAALNAIECVVPAMPAGWGIGKKTVQLVHDDGVTPEQQALTGPTSPKTSVLEYEFADSTDARVVARAAYTKDADYIAASCKDCVTTAGLNSYCIADCAGVLGGVAVLDSCNVCSGGTSTHILNSDKNCQGICFGKVMTASECLTYDAEQAAAPRYVTTDISETLIPLQTYKVSITVITAIFAALVFLYFMFYLVQKYWFGHEDVVLGPDGQPKPREMTQEERLAAMSAEMEERVTLASPRQHDARGGVGRRGGGAAGAGAGRNVGNGEGATVVVAAALSQPSSIEEHDSSSTRVIAAPARSNRPTPVVSAGRATGVGRGQSPHSSPRTLARRV